MARHLLKVMGLTAIAYYAVIQLLLAGMGL